MTIAATTAVVRVQATRASTSPSSGRSRPTASEAARVMHRDVEQDRGDATADRTGVAPATDEEHAHDPRPQQPAQLGPFTRPSARRWRTHRRATATAMRPEGEHLPEAQQRLRHSVGDREAHQLGRDAGHGRGVDDVVGREHQHQRQREGGHQHRRGDGPPAATQQLAGGVEQEQGHQPGQQHGAEAGHEPEGSVGAHRVVRVTVGEPPRQGAVDRPDDGDGTEHEPDAVARPLAQHPRRRGGEDQPGQGTGKANPMSAAGPLGIRVRHVEPDRSDQAGEPDDQGTYAASAARGCAGRRAAYGSREQYHRERVPPSGTTVPVVGDRARGPGPGPRSLTGGSSGGGVFRHAATAAPHLIEQESRP